MFSNQSFTGLGPQLILMPCFTQASSEGTPYFPYKNASHPLYLSQPLSIITEALQQAWCTGVSTASAVYKQCREVYTSLRCCSKAKNSNMMERQVLYHVCLGIMILSRWGLLPSGDERDAPSLSQTPVMDSINLFSYCTAFLYSLPGNDRSQHLVWRYACVNEALTHIVGFLWPE